LFSRCWTQRERPRSCGSIAASVAPSAAPGRSSCRVWAFKQAF